MTYFIKDLLKFLFLFFNPIYYLFLYSFKELFKKKKKFYDLSFFLN
jgi:hypothetical protein